MLVDICCGSVYEYVQDDHGEVQLSSFCMITKI